MITINPTHISIVRRGNFPASLAAIGAAIAPPIIKPAIICQCVMPINIKNDMALANVTKNSLKLTLPITYWGLLPFAIKVLVTKGPQPPPPKLSRKPPAPASQPARFTFFIFLPFLYAWYKIRTPSIKQ